jgi:hypothetical protein
MEATVTFCFNSIGPKHRMPLRQLDSAFFHQELKQFISLCDIKVISPLGLLDPALIHCQRLLPPRDLCCSYIQFIVRILEQISLVQELVVDVSDVVLLAKFGVLLEALSLIAHQ